MRIRSLLSVGVAVVGSLVVAACVGDPSPTATAVQGDLNGPCFVNGTCNAGLTCGVVKGAATCVPAADASPADASPGVDGATTDDSGLPACGSAHTSFPCKDIGSTTTCYGATQSCTGSLCSGPDVSSWFCFSPNQCTGLPCCLSAKSATLHQGTGCTQRTLEMLPGAAMGANCGSGNACGTGDGGPPDTQLCQSNAQCPPGQFCSVVKVASVGDGGSAALNGTILGACAPP